MHEFCGPGDVQPAICSIFSGEGSVKDQTERLKSRVHPTYKTKYRVRNWASYDRAVPTRKSIWSRISTSEHDLSAQRAAIRCARRYTTSSRPSSLPCSREVTGRGYRGGRDLEWASDGWRVVAAAGQCLPASVGYTRRGARRSGRAAFVSMMKPADLGDCDDGAIAGRREQSRNRRVLVQRQVSAGPFVVRTVAGHQSQQACFIEDDHVIETVATSRSNKSFDEWILPRRAGRRDHFLDAHRRCPQAVERVIAIVEQISRRFVPRKGLAELLGRPRRRRMRGDGHVANTSSIVGEEHQDE